jgi:hypothetical protein
LSYNNRSLKFMSEELPEVGKIRGFCIRAYSIYSS